MGWDDGHLHEFSTRDGRHYGPREAGLDFEVIDSRRGKLSTLLPRVGSRALYEYDFGDGWEHDLKVVAIVPPITGVRYPRCIAGERACPPDDVGGVYGYAEMLEALGDPNHEEHGYYLEWLGNEFDPDAFDVESINQLLAEYC